MYMLAADADSPGVSWLTHMQSPLRFCSSHHDKLIKWICIIMMNSLVRFVSYCYFASFFLFIFIFPHNFCTAHDLHWNYFSHQNPIYRTDPCHCHSTMMTSKWIDLVCTQCSLAPIIQMFFFHFCLALAHETMIIILRLFRVLLMPTRACFCFLLSAAYLLLRLICILKSNSTCALQVYLCR